MSIEETPSPLDGSLWISAADAAVRNAGEDPFKGKAEAESGTACFLKSFVNAKPVAEAHWTVSGLGVFRAFVNGAETGAGDLLKPGFTHFAKTKHCFRYDVTALLRTGAGEENTLCGCVSAGWWRDKVVLFRGKRSAFRAVLLLRHPDGSETRIPTDTSWLASGAAGPVVHAAIFDGEDFDARIAPPWALPPTAFSPAIENTEFKGAVVPMEGPAVCLRRDIALAPVETYVWQGVEGAGEDRFGRVVVKRKCSNPADPVSIAPGETLILDFGQNCAAVPEFVFAASRGTVLTARPAEMLNDGDGLRSRHCDGPGGSAYIAEYRSARTRARYVFAGEKEERYRPTFTYYGGRYLSVTSEGGPVEIRSVRWIPVSSVHADAETGSLETGDASLNRFIENIVWGQRSNYLSVPTDCPQRAERLGWTADTQVFAKAACYNADVRDFLRKWMRDMRDSRFPDGGFPGVAPTAMIGELNHQFGWGDAGIIVPYVVWRHFGDTAIVRENWEAMERYMALVEEHKFDSPDARNHQWADWLSLEKLETASGRAYVGGVKNVPPVKEDALALWRYFGACYWLSDAMMMAEMEAAGANGAGGTATHPSRYAAMAARARAYIREHFVDPASGLLAPLFRDMQTPALFALKLGFLDPAPARATRDALLANIHEHGDCLQTGFLGTAIILDVLADQCDAPEAAYSLLLQHGFPSWLYSVDQGATTVWESWDAYTVANGFSPGMRSFNHYAYGAILAWLYATAAGIREDPAAPGWKHFILAPRPDPRLGRLSASYRSPAGTIESSWRYDENGALRWNFSIPEGATATVFEPGNQPRTFGPGKYEFSQDNGHS